MVDQSKERDDEITQEIADIHRLIEAGTRNDDALTKAAGIARSGRLARKGMDITNPVAAKILGLDKLSQSNED